MRVVWRDPMNHHNHCYFCMLDMAGWNSRKQKTWLLSSDKVYLSSTVGHPTPIYKCMLFPLCILLLLLFFYLFYLTSIRCILLLFTTCQTSSTKNLFVLATGLTESLTHTSFTNPLWFQYVRTHQCAKPKFLMFLYSLQHAINSYSLMLFFFLLLDLCYFVIWVTKMLK